MKRSEILDAAKKCVCQDRNEQYGSPEDNFGKIAELWSAYRGELFLKRDVAMMMALVKIARIYAGETEDSYIDLAGYAACGGELASEEKKEEKSSDPLIMNRSLSYAGSYQRLCSLRRLAASLYTFSSVRAETTMIFMTVSSRITL